jgi:hypothetical protein
MIDYSWWPISARLWQMWGIRVRCYNLSSLFSPLSTIHYLVAHICPVFGQMWGIRVPCYNLFSLC